MVTKNEQLKGNAGQDGAQQVESKTAIQAVDEESKGGTGKNKANNGETAQKSEIYVYIGPDLPKAALKSNTIYRGSLAEIEKYHEKTFARYPKARQMFVPPEIMETMRTEASTEGRVMNMYYRALQKEAE